MPKHWEPSSKLYICVDFDGVLNRYTHYKGVDVFEDAVPGAAEAMQYLHARHWVIIHTTRPDTPAIRKWLADRNIPFHYWNENPDRTATGQLDPRKPIADVYVDDKGITFNGNWPEIVHAIENFRPWYRQ